MPPTQLATSFRAAALIDYATKRIVERERAPTLDWRAMRPFDRSQRIFQHRLPTTAALSMKAAMKETAAVFALALAADHRAGPSREVSPLLRRITASSAKVSSRHRTATIAADPATVNLLYGFVCDHPSAIDWRRGGEPTITNWSRATADLHLYHRGTARTWRICSLIVPFTTPRLPANAPNTAIVVSLPSLGAGNTKHGKRWGYQRVGEKNRFDVWPCSVNTEGHDSRSALASQPPPPTPLGSVLEQRAAIRA